MPSAQDLANLRMQQQMQKQMQEANERLLQQQTEMAKEMAARGQKAEDAGMMPINPPTTQEAKEINGYLNWTLDQMQYFTGQNFTMPKPRTEPPQ
jgi:hypothetical protein